MAEERISNIRTVRSFGREGYEIQNYNSRIDEVLKTSQSESLARACFFGLTGELNIISLAGWVCKVKSPIMKLAFIHRHCRC